MGYDCDYVPKNKELGFIQNKFKNLKKSGYSCKLSSSPRPQKVNIGSNLGVYFGVISCKKGTKSENDIVGIVAERRGRELCHKTISERSGIGYCPSDNFLSVANTKYPTTNERAKNWRENCYYRDVPPQAR